MSEKMQHITLHIKISFQKRERVPSKQQFIFCFDSPVFLNVFKIAQITQTHEKKLHFVIYQTIDGFLYFISSAKFSEIFYIVFFKVFVTYPTFSQ